MGGGVPRRSDNGAAGEDGANAGDSYSALGVRCVVCAVGSSGLHQLTCD